MYSRGKKELLDLSKNPSLRTYSKFKTEYNCEPYLTHIKKYKYLVAFSQLRAGSHTLEIERGRYANPRKPVNERLCAICKEVEDEQHFITKCLLYKKERLILFEKVKTIYASFPNFTEQEKFIFLLSSSDCKVLSWTGKFIYNSMHARAVHHSTT